MWLPTRARSQLEASSWGPRELDPDDAVRGGGLVSGVVANGFWRGRSKKTAPGRRDRIALGLWSSAWLDSCRVVQIVKQTRFCIRRRPDDQDGKTTRATNCGRTLAAAPRGGGRQPCFAFRRLVFQRRFVAASRTLLTGVPVFGGTAADNKVTGDWSLFSSKGRCRTAPSWFSDGHRSKSHVVWHLASCLRAAQGKTKVDGYWLKETDDSQR